MSTQDACAAPQEIFREQIDCIRQDDREMQLQLYAEDCIDEFPFATDQPRRLAGRDEIRRVMDPLWEEARRMGVKVIGCDAIVHVTLDPSIIVTEFILSVKVRDSVSRIPFVQVLRIRDGRITQVREYFSPAARSEALGRPGTTTD